MKTIYKRMVIFFMGVVLLSLVIVIPTTHVIVRDETVERLQNELISISEEAIHNYVMLDPEHRVFYLKNAEIFNYYFYIYDDMGNYQYYGKPDRETKIPEERVKQVLQGNIYRGLTDKSVENFDDRVLGMPFQDQGISYALFIQADYSAVFFKINYLVYILVSVFLLGSVLISITSRYIVKPIRSLTEATEQVAKGDFDIHLDIKNRDEIGKLASSFKRMAQELSQIDQMRQDFVSNISHEIQSPLTSIRGFSKALKDNMIPENERNEYLDIIEAESERLSKLSENLMKIVSLDSMQHPLEKTTYHLDEQIRKNVVFLEPQWGEKSIDVDVALPRVNITADEHLLDQVWINIISNSIKFTPEGGSITISMQIELNQITVAVADTGIGIAPQDLESIFLRFYKADKSRDRRQSGNGLGLSIVEKIIALHGGSVKIDSEVGEGTTVYVTVPIK